VNPKARSELARRAFVVPTCSSGRRNRGLAIASHARGKILPLERKSDSTDENRTGPDPRRGLLFEGSHRASL
jgi:hypothetical protein